MIPKFHINNTQPKAIIFDVDGVLIRFPHYFSQELENNGYKHASKILNTFYKSNIIHDCSEGNAEAKEKILPFLKKIGWKDTAEEYFIKQYQFEKQYLDKNFISIIQELRKNNIKCYLGTDQEKNRANLIQKSKEIEAKFDGHFISCFIGYRKCQDSFWTHLLTTLKNQIPNIKPEEIVFFDDIQNNIDVASKHGIKSILFTNMTKFTKDLNTLQWKFQTNKQT